jgi:hypothetical protein
MRLGNSVGGMKTAFEKFCRAKFCLIAGQTLHKRFN